MAAGGTVAQLADHLAEDHETVVNIGPLPEAIADGSRLRGTFRSRQVDEVQVRDHDGATSVLTVTPVVGRVGALDDDAEDCVRT